MRKRKPSVQRYHVHMEPSVSGGAEERLSRALLDLASVLLDIAVAGQRRERKDSDDRSMELVDPLKHRETRGPKSHELREDRPALSTRKRDRPPASDLRLPRHSKPNRRRSKAP